MEITNIPAISVIIPMYNVEKYIGECLDSILMQTFQDFEVIIVNDCSTDNSLQIAESYLEKFGGRLKIHVNKKNSGAGASRNNGLRLSRGEYVYYMDSDDLLLLTGLEEMYKAAKEFNSDVVNLPGFYFVSEDLKEITIAERKRKIFGNNENVALVDDDLIQRMQTPLNSRFFSGPVLRLFKRDFLLENKIFFPENVKRCEDVVWKYGFLFSAKRIVHIPRLFYLYRMVSNSMTRQKRTRSQYINSRMTTIIDGIKWIDDIMNQVKFFEQNPQYRYKIFEEFVSDLFKRILSHSRRKNWTALNIYEAVKQGFSEKLGKYDVLVAELSSLIDSQMKEIADLKEQLKAPDKEKIL